LVFHDSSLSRQFKGVIRSPFGSCRKGDPPTISGRNRSSPPSKPLIIQRTSHIIALASWCASALVAQIDRSPHLVKFIPVDKIVKLEVLDWGGSGRPLVLLAGLGGTAHVFDTFALKLTGIGHVYGITRRGYGQSAVPDSGYSADRLGDDVREVLDALKLEHPILVGHSIAGEELSSVGSRYPKRVAGLVYMDAAYGYAFYDRTRGDLNIDLIDLQRKLKEFQRQQDTDTRALIRELLATVLPEFERDLKKEQEFLATLPPAMLAAGTSTPKVASSAIVAGAQKYTEIPVLILAIFAVPHDMGATLNADPVLRAAFDAHDKETTGAQARAFELGVPSARVLRIPHASHFIFKSNEAEVVRDIAAFVSQLP
jgi:non-heme chloroperoxidase